ncbi:MAG TPA: DUF1732 domain-containing protein [Holophagaceae bacterium]|nr:DUF1732 domain-containing protein [Holophagaceae bacterium]
MRSMTAYAELIRPFGTGRLRLSLRSVNGKGLDLNLRLHPALFPLETALRTRVQGAAKRGKLDLAVELQDAPELEPQVNRALLRSLAKTWQEDAEWLALPPMTAEAFFRVPGAFLPPDSDLAERVESPLVEALDALLKDWNARRTAEADRLRPFFEEALGRLKALRGALQAEAEAQAAELPALYAARLEQVLKDARLEGQLPAERLVAEAGALAERQDVREELVRLAAHLDDFGTRLAKGALEGKWTDVWAQEVLRELNTCGSKCKRLAMTRAVMEAKGALDQLREQAANLE